MRGASNAILRLLDSHGDSVREHGILTASAGNFSQGVLFVAARLGLKTTVLVPDHAPQTKLDAMRRLDPNCTLLFAPFDEWFAFATSGGRVIPARFRGGGGSDGNGDGNGDTKCDTRLRGCFVSPVTSVDVMDGNGTMALEVVEQLREAGESDLDERDAVLVPWGGGAMALGIAAAFKEMGSRVRVYACEVDTAAPLGPSLAAGAPVSVDYTPTFVDGMGAGSVAPVMFARAQRLLAGTVTVSPGQIARAIGTLVTRACLVAEGAGAAAFSAAINHSKERKWRRVICILSGGNIDAGRLTACIADQTPD